MVHAKSRVRPASDAVLERLSRLHPKIIDLSLSRVERLLAALGHPERRLPPVVHVAGTNGKGSVLAYLRAMFEASGRRVHVYVSPHLVRFNERIRLAGTLIDEPLLIELLEECERANGGEPITFFEITTAAAFLAFERAPADVLLLETGLGGRLDATNVIDRPLATAITPVSMDHMQFLGDSLAAIAGEKAGILKAGVPAAIGPQPSEAMAVIESRAAEIGASLHRFGAEWSIEPDGEGFVYRGPMGSRRLPRPNLPGRHQIDNAGVALACLDLMGAGFALTRPHIAAGLTSADWPARLQRLTRGPLSDMLPEGSELWLDGGHNEAAGAVLAEMAKGWQDRPLHLVFGMLETKEPRAFLAHLAPLVRSLQAVPIPGEHASLTPAQSAAHARAAGIAAAEADDVEAAVAAILKAEREPCRILICGSLYLAGTVLAENG
ncbi:MAG TPA: folylpolyglutamate synthase/dihydrofolate synthase family protein [Methylomirabilota bacterium]|jgi:dihydrofolate synthase / folylpolyglutamate synthase|nr:folylpolyglutamate synthase/dihydrofolate synthase family protein [Methylomirabilota bacterium]